MARRLVSRIPVSCVVSAFIGVLLILHTPLVLAQELSFSPVVTYETGGEQASSVAVADVNADGKPDLVVTNCGGCYGPPFIGHGGSIGVLLGNGDGTFQPATIYDSGGSVPVFVAVADVNDDGKPDLVVVNRNSNDIGVLLGNGDGTFQPAVTYGSGSGSPLLVAVADVNGDGKPDLLVAHFCSGPINCDGLVGVLLGNGDGTFQPAVTYSSGGQYASAVVVADVNGDGKPDMLVTTNVYTCCTPGGAVGVLLGNGDGTFQPAVTYHSGQTFIQPASSRLAVADINGDGKPDLIVEDTACCNSANGAVSVLLGNGDGTFQPVVTYKSGAGGWGTSVAVADVNGDGKPDIVATDQCASANCLNNGLVAVLLGNGDGTFQTAQTYSAGGFLTNSVAVADVNGDSKPDLVVANICADDTTYCRRTSVGVLLNNSSFCTTPPVVTISATPTSLWPPNGKMVPVTVSGTITDTGCSVARASYAVTDEYGQVQPTGPVTVGPGGSYTFTVLLQASRLGTDLDGRLYTITVSASNNAGKTGSQAGAVIVPHDQGH
jgi:hypothetical protein